VLVGEVLNWRVLAAVAPWSEICVVDPAKLLNTRLFRSNVESNVEVYPPAVCSGELPNPMTTPVPGTGATPPSQFVGVDQVVVPPTKLFQV
jgi:hypothetical protein